MIPGRLGIDDHGMADDGGGAAQPADDEARWAAAQSVLDAAPDETALGRLRRFRLLTWSLVLGVVLLVPAIVALVVVTASDAFLPATEPSDGWVVAGLVCQGAGLLVLAGYGVIAWRAGVFRGAWSQPAAVLDRRQRRALLAQVRGRAPVDARRLPLARSAAERLVLQRHLVLLFVGLALQQVGRALSSPSTLQLVLTAVTVLVFLVGAVLLLRDAHRAEEFLRAHPADDRRGADRSDPA